MAIKSYRVGPGTLKLGAAGVDDFSCQVMSARCVPSPVVKTLDAVAVLCGETLESDEAVTYDWVLEVKFLQDIEDAGIIAYTWTNAGSSKAFELIPNTAKARKITGTVRVDPIAAGGDVDTRPDSDASWKITGGAPVLAAV